MCKITHCLIHQGNSQTSHCLIHQERHQTSHCLIHQERRQTSRYLIHQERCQTRHCLIHQERCQTSLILPEIRPPADTEMFQASKQATRSPYISVVTLVIEKVSLNLVV